MNVFTLLILGVILVVLVVGVFFGILFLTLFIYVVSHLYPWLRKIGVWAARPENLLSLIILAMLLIIVIILASVLLHATLLLLLIVFPILLFPPYRSGYTGIGAQAYQLAVRQVERLARQHLYRHTVTDYKVQDKGRCAEGNRLEDQIWRDEEQVIRRG
jgi:hypothetical protein